MRIAIYDLDRTLTAQPTFTPFLVFAARGLAPWRLALLPVWVAAMIGYRLGFYGRTALKRFGLRLMLGQHARGDLRALGASFAAHHIARSGWREDVMALLAEDREAGATLVIATAAFGFYAKAFARDLGLEHVIATEWNGRAI
ncbi:MAG: haloacid dehalogenase-like hydrolase, partial [Alteraurantiacibacter sp.]